jgi:hypothetical protein
MVGRSALVNGVASTDQGSLTPVPFQFDYDVTLTDQPVSARARRVRGDFVLALARLS